MKISTIIHASTSSWDLGGFYPSAAFIEDVEGEEDSTPPVYAVIPKGNTGIVAKAERTLLGVDVKLLSLYKDTVFFDKLVHRVLPSLEAVPRCYAINFNASSLVVGVSRMDKPHGKRYFNWGQTLDFCHRFGLHPGIQFSTSEKSRFVHAVLMNLARCPQNSSKVIVYVGSERPKYMSRCFILGPLILVLGTHLKEVMRAKDDTELMKHLLWVQMYDHIPQIAHGLYRQITETGLQFNATLSRLGDLYQEDST